jgi:L-ascorbate metabolism protein UlaG (beta-lactamase superfamily)
MRVRRLTWAGIMVEVGETALFVDVMPVDPKNGDPAELLTATKKPAAIVTHRHADHFSNAALRTVLGENGRLVAQSETLPGMDTRGLQVQSVSMWEPSFFPTWLGSDIVAFAVPAVDGFGTPQCSWIIDGGGSRIFHGGDTQWHGRWAEYGRAYGPFDAAFLPINGARMNLGRLTDDGVPAVLTPEQAVIAAGRLGANRLIPIHFGEPDPPTYNEVDHPLDRICSAAAGQVPLTVLQPGDWLTIEHSAHGRGPVSGAARQR